MTHTMLIETSALTLRMEVEILRPNWAADRSTDAKSFSARCPVVADMGTI